jgi:hypothetical protein
MKIQMNHSFGKNQFFRHIKSPFLYKTFLFGMDSP